MKLFLLLLLLLNANVGWGEGWKSQPADNMPELLKNWLASEPILKMMRSRIVFSSGIGLTDLQQEPSAVFGGIAVPVVSGVFPFTNDTVFSKDKTGGFEPMRWITDLVWFDLNPSAEKNEMRQAGIKAEYGRLPNDRFALFGLTYCQSKSSCQRHGIPISPEKQSTPPAVWSDFMVQRACDTSDWDVALNALPTDDSVVRFGLARFTEALGLGSISQSLLPLDLEMSATALPGSVQLVKLDVNRIAGRLRNVLSQPESGRLTCQVRVPLDEYAANDSRRVLYLIGSHGTTIAGFRLEYFMRFNTNHIMKPRLNLASLTLCGNRAECSRLRVVK